MGTGRYSPSPGPRCAHLHPGQPAMLPAGFRKRLPQAGETDLWGKEKQRQHVRGECSLGGQQCETPTHQGRSVTSWSGETDHGKTDPRQNQPAEHLVPLDTARPEDSLGSSQNQSQARLGGQRRGCLCCVSGFPRSRAGPGRGCSLASARPCGRVSSLCPTPGLLTPHRGRAPPKALGSPVQKEMVKSGRAAGKQWRRTEAQRLANWRAGPARGEGRAPGQCPPEPGAGKARRDCYRIS